MKLSSIFSYHSNFYRSIAALIIGILVLFMKPDEVPSKLVILIGVFVLLSGIGTALAAYRSEHNLVKSMAGSTAIISLIFGVLLIVRPDWFVNFIISLFGIVLLLVGIMQLANVIGVKKNLQNLTFYLVAGAIPTLMGIVFLFFQEQVKTAIGIMLGLTLIVYALNELGLGFRMHKFFKSDNVEDVKFEDVEE